MPAWCQETASQDKAGVIPPSQREYGIS